jgi:mannosyl-oligosaccharide alpha-1,2-mannosidase
LRAQQEQRQQAALIAEAKKAAAAAAQQEAAAAAAEAAAAAAAAAQAATAGGGNSQDNRDVEKQTAVKDAFLHAWNAYEKRCFGQDELKPLTNTCENWLNAGLTIIDSLGTMHIMGLHAEFGRARDFVVNRMNLHVAKSVSFFESVIRIIGGLLSAFDLTGDRAFLEKAHDCGRRLSKAFKTPSGMPKAQVNLATGAIANPGWTGGASLLAEVGTVQLEFAQLARHTGDATFKAMADKVLDVIDRGPAQRLPGLYPIYIDPISGRFRPSKITFGAMGDSFYEYLVKYWVLSGKTDARLQRMYVQSMDSALLHAKERLGDRRTILLDINQGGHKERKMDHLACFVPGMLALGVHHGIVRDAKAAEHMRVARELAETCYQMYAQFPHGVAPEYVRFDAQGGMQAGDPSYNLRPETVESFFIMWRVTKDPVYREYGWTVFQSVQRACRVPNGFVSLHDVRDASLRQKNKMESFFLAETLKYLYLLFSEDSLISLDDWTFNTEAHPLRNWA